MQALDAINEYESASEAVSVIDSMIQKQISPYRELTKVQILLHRRQFLSFCTLCVMLFQVFHFNISTVQYSILRGFGQPVFDRRWIESHSS